MWRQAVLGVWLSLVGATALAADSDFLEAREAFRAGDVDTLTKAHHRLGESPLRAYSEMWLLWRRMDTVDADEVQRFLRKERGQLVADKLRERWLEELAKRHQWQAFLNEYEQLIDRSSPLLNCLHWRAHWETDRDIDLRPAIDELWLTVQDLPSACSAVHQRMQAKGLLTPDVYWQRIRLAMEANKPGLVRFLLNGLGEGLADSLWQRIRTEPQAYLVAAKPSSRLSRELMAYAYGRWARQDMAAASEALYREQEGLAEQAAWAWRQVAMAAALVLDEQTELWFSRSESAAWTSAHVEARLRLLLRRGDWSALLNVLDAQPEAFQQARMWQYWRARAKQALAEAAVRPSTRKALQNEARKILATLSTQEDYYGLLAAETLGQAITALAEPERIGARDAERLSGDVAFQRAFALYGLGLRWESVSAFNWAVRIADDNLKLAASAQANRSGWYDRAIYAAERTTTRHEPRFLYLTPYRSEVRDTAREHSLSEAWVYGLIRQESRFVSAAKSSVGANGLMQLMPGTARWVADKLGMDMAANSVHEPKVNIRLGGYYLKHLSDMLGHPVLATAGYNAGPRRAKAWQSNVPLDATRYIDSIPFSETRDYVKKVIANAVHYGRVFNQPNHRVSDYLGVIPALTNQAVEGP